MTLAQVQRKHHDNPEDISHLIDEGCGSGTGDYRGDGNGNSRDSTSDEYGCFVVYCWVEGTAYGNGLGVGDGSGNWWFNSGNGFGNGSGDCAGLNNFFF